MSEQWQALIDFIKRSKIAAMLNKNQRKQLLAIAYYKLANSYFSTWDYQNAYDLAYEGYKQFSDFVPNLVLLARVAYATKNYDEAIKYVKAVWVLQPNSSAAEVIVSIGKNYENTKFLKLIKSISAYAPMHYESHLLVARAALDTQEFDEASKEIAYTIEGDLRFRACLMMAEYCQRTHGNIAEILNWLKRAINAEIDLYNKLYFWDLNTMSITDNPSNNCFPIAKL
jgi:HemY protein